MSRWVYRTSDPVPDSVSDPKTLLGGKGAGLNAMARAGLPVPPAFTLTTEACAYYFEHDRCWPDDLEEEVRDAMAWLEEQTGRTFAAGPHPLLVSVRSGAAVSMPGMMDTLLNVGLHEELADQVDDDPAHFWDLYYQFITMYAKTVGELSAERFLEQAGGSDGPETPASPQAVEQAIELFERETGQPFPRRPWEMLIACIDTVFESWENDRAIRYRRHHDIRGLRGTAVNVQAMFPSQVSGILFSQDPNSLEAERIIIEGTWGLGEAIVSGDVTPDRYVVSRHDFRDVRSTIGSKTGAVRALGETDRYDPQAPCLSAAQIEELCELAMRVERYFEMPVDIEWGLADGRFAVLQSRAIRGLDVARDVEIGRQAEVERLRALCNGRPRVWVTHNLGETLRTPTPLTWDIIRRFMSGDGGFGRMYRDFGYRPSARVCERGFLELICGRIYADPDRLAELFWDGLPMRYDVDELRTDPAQLDRAPQKFDPDAVDERFLWKLPGLLTSMVRSSRRMKRLRDDAADRYEQRVLPAFLEYVRSARAQDLTAMTTAELLDTLDERRRWVLDEFGGESLKPGFAGGMALDELRGLLTELAGPEEGEALANTLTSGLENDITFEQDAMLYEVGRGEQSMEALLEQFGHRALGEMELMEPRWREDPTYLENLAVQLANSDRSPMDRHERTAARRREAEAALPNRLAEWGGRSFEESIHQMLADARRLLPYREKGKYHLMMGYELIRQVIVELGRRWDLGQGIFFLELEELRRFESDRQSLLQTIASRRLRWRSAQQLDMPDIVDSRQLDQLGLSPEPTEPTGGGGVFTGEAVASGVATGTARLVRDPREAGDLGADYVLVCPSTDPGWTPLFVNAAGLIVERGGTLSHGAIVARDFGIPAVVLAGATGLIADGQTVRVDGNQGRVAVVQEVGP